MGYAVFYEDLVYQFRSRSPAEVCGKLWLHRLPATTQSGPRRTWAKRTGYSAGQGPDRFIEIFSVPSWETAYVSMNVG